MEENDKSFDRSGSNQYIPGKIPGPPPNPRRRLTKDDYLAPQAFDDSLDLTIPCHEVFHKSANEAAEIYSVDQDMSLRAELQVSMEEVNPGRLAKSDKTETSIPANNNSHVAITMHGDFPVIYSKQNGDVALRSDTVTIPPDGRQVIQTSNYQSAPYRSGIEQPLTRRRQRILKYLSLVAAFLFFPTGIPAAFFAFKTEKEFYAGILRGNIDTAKKCAKRAEKLIIFSFLLFIMVIVLTFALYQRSKWTDADYSGHRILPNAGL